MANKPKKLTGKQKLVLAGGLLALLLTGGAVYLKSRKTEESEDFFPDPAPAPPVVTTSEYPIKKGSRGAKVKILQKALISVYGPSILPRYGADGIWGGETEAAFVKANLARVITLENHYKEILGKLAFAGPQPVAGLLGNGPTGRKVHTRRPAVIWDGGRSMTEMPEGTYLGRWVGSRGGVTEFRSPKGRRLFTYTDSVLLQ